MAFDTLRYVKRLEAAGISREQAEALAEALKPVLRKVLGNAGSARYDFGAPLMRRLEKVLLMRTIALVIALSALGWFVFDFRR